MLHYLVWLIIYFAVLVQGNTEIINFSVDTLLQNSSPSFDGNTLELHLRNRPVVDALHYEHHLSIPPAPLNTPLPTVCEPVLNLSAPCPHEAWLLLNLGDPSWHSYHKFTARVSWPTSSPASFDMTISSPPGYMVSDRMGLLRIRVVDTGVRTPWSGSSSSSASEPDRHTTTADRVPFILVIEPLYLGLVPVSLLPVIGVLLVVITLATAAAGRIHFELTKVAEFVNPPYHNVKQD